MAHFTRRKSFPFKSDLSRRDRLRARSRPRLEQLEDRLTPSNVLRGSYGVDLGPFWANNPVAYSAREAAALIFGGYFSDYAVSTSNSTITYTGWYDGWGAGATVQQQDFVFQTGTGYNSPGGAGTAYSAYVRDHSVFGPNYVWQLDTSTPADVAVTSNTISGALTAGGQVVYTITVINNGPFAAPGVVVTDQPDPNTTFVSASAPAGWTATTTSPLGVTGGTVMFSIPSLAVGSSATFTVTEQVKPGTAVGTVLNNTAVIGSELYDNVPTNNTKTASTAVGTPYVTTLSAGTATEHSIITVNGGSFTPSSVVRFNGVNAATTTFISSTQLQATVPEAGSYTLTVFDPVNGTSNGVSFTSTDAPLSNLADVPFSVVEGAAFSGTVASFTDSDPGAPGDPTTNPADYSATITWGDGSTSPGTIVYAGTSGNFTVTGSHTYAEEGTQASSFFVTIHHGTLADVSTPAVSVTVRDAPLTAGALTPPVTDAGQPFGDVTVFHFTDADPNGTAADYTALVTLGDGNTVTLTGAAGPNGQIVAAGGGFDVLLSYTYAHALSNQTFSVQVKDHSATAGAATSTFSVSPDATALTVISSLSSSVYGEAVTFTATVTNTTSGSSLVPTGTVQFYIDGVAYGAAQPLDGGGHASISDNQLPVTGSPHSITVTYSNSDGDFSDSNGGLSGGETITPATLTIAADPQTKVYGAADPALTYQASGFQLTDTANSVLTGTLARAGGESVAGGPYAINQGTLSADSNYVISFTGASLTITPATLTVTADPQTKVYGAADPALTYQASGFQFSDTAGSVLSGALARAGGESVAGGPYAISQGTLSANSNYTINFAGASLTITPATLTVTANAQTKVYGGADPAPTYQVNGLQFSDTAGGVLTGALSRAAGESVAGGPYAISQGTLAADSNYTISFTGASLTITPATLTVAANAQTKVYGGADPALTYQANGFQFGDTAGGVLTGTLSRAAGESVAGGPYAIGQGSLAANSNYTINFTGASLSITPATLTVTANPQTKVYGQGDPALTYQASGFEFSDTAATVLTGALARAAGQDAGNYAISEGTLAADANYVLQFTGNTLTITRANQSISWSNPAPITYGTPLGAAQLNATVSLVGPAAAGALTYTPAAGILLGPGSGQVLTVTVAATKDYNAATLSVPIDVVYRFSGFLSPVSPNAGYPPGSVVPIRFQLADAQGHFISSLSAVKSLQVVAVKADGSLGTPFNPTAADGMRLSYDPATHEYVFNWQTRGLAAGKYEVLLSLADGTTRSVSLTLSSCGAAADNVFAAAEQVLLGALSRLEDALAYLNTALASFGVNLTSAAPGNSVGGCIYFG
jgi:uncharacterized repeat protein (TIGR01451 family)